ncbi:reverse transcriptase domain-containing protein [Tanacetum coccineum]
MTRFCSYAHGSPLLENSSAFKTQNAAEKTSAALGRILMLDLVIINDDRLPCYYLQWRGNSANLLLADKMATANHALEDAFDSAIKRCIPRVLNALEFSSKGDPYASENKKADALSKIASTSFAHLSKQVLVEKHKEKLINEMEVLAVVEEEGDTWMTPIYEYLTEETLSTEVNKARVGTDMGMPRLLGSLTYLEKFATKVDPNHIPMAILQMGNRQSWIFLGRSCLLRREIISDNGKQFRDNPFKDWCEKLCIRQGFASMKHPQANGLVERANQSLEEGIKARLDARRKDWMEEISHVLWAHRTMIKSSNGDTPFLLTYGTEAVIPAEIGMPTLRTAEVDVVRNDEALEISPDLLEERRE